ncbi:MAG: 3-dehydroquinate synthase [Betaproteobacteria bacterium ADurb.Bin341]|nr:MAG: 3-dehydroquinate synthase [Betaproteobacteria bacterium ADurb.Bin341]
MRTVTVALAERPYSILIGNGLLDQPGNLLPLLSQPKVMVVSNTTVAPLYLTRLRDTLTGAGVSVQSVVLPDGEAYKNWETLNLIFDALISSHCERNTTLMALGGGVIGDMGGFAAACYQRGMPFIQLPTTLLAQVDSSVGGKTAINHPLGKNMIGAFYQPKRVLADISTLATLEDRQLRAGISEIIKIALIRDASFLSWLEEHLDRLLARDCEILEDAVERACRNKAEVVVADEFERGERALLNLGHTFGHAIEAGLGFGVWLHGEAVAAGTMMAAELSRKMGYLADADVERIETLFSRAGLPVHGPADLPPERYLDLMCHDKKVEGKKLRLILLSAPGRALMSDQAGDGELLDAIRSRSA